MENTVDDFWSMVMEHNVSVIIMVTYLYEYGVVCYNLLLTVFMVLDVSVNLHRRNAFSIGQREGQQGMETQKLQIWKKFIKNTT